MKFKKIISVLASAVMLSSTIGFAAAATFPAPFDSGSAIVYGANGNVQIDMAAAVNLQTAIGQIGGSDGELGIPEGSWRVATTSDDLELNESIKEVTTYIDKDNLPILADGVISNEKGTAKYTQSFYFDDATSSKVTYANDGDDNIGLFYKVSSGEVIARYVMDFTTNLKSDITSGSLEDIKDEDINILGKTYSITTATNGTSGVELTLMSGANKLTVSNGEEQTVGGKTVSVIVSASNAAQFTIDGQTTNKLAEGDTYKLDDGSYLGVSDITYQNFAGGMMQSTIYLGADKIELKNSSSMTVNADTISYADVTISSTESGGDISISQITVNMTAEDDLYVPVGGKLSEASDLDKPQVLLTQNWDIGFTGLDNSEYEEFSIKKSTDSKMKLYALNYNGDQLELPLVFVNSSGIFGGEKSGYRLILNATNSITKNDYFILNTANPTSSTANARSYVVQYKGADKTTDTDAKMKFNVVGVDSSDDVTLSSTGTATLKLGGASFTFGNTSAYTANDFSIKLTSTVGDYATGSDVNGALNNYIRTKYNSLVNITQGETNVSAAPSAYGTAWTVSLVTDDANKDGDKYGASATNTIVTETFLNNSDNEVATTPTTSTAGTSWESDPSDNTKSTYIDFYGNEITHDNPSSSPDDIVVKIPESIVTPKVYITSGAISAGTTGTGGLAPIVDDSKVDTVKDKNLIVVGGSCINQAAAKILGSDVPLCESAFTAKTGAGAGQYIIETVVSPYNTGKVAMLVAGYNGVDTTAAAQRVVDDSLSPETTDAAIVYPVVA